MSDQLRLFGNEVDGQRVTPPREPSDANDRRAAVDPRQNVVLEASAGTGKTSVLVARYLNLLRAEVDPANILAITFTRKAATEMRERIVAELRRASGRSAADRRRWIELRDRLGEIGIQTIDAFCLSLLREFPLEADLDPGFEMADETEVPRIVDQALDGALRIAIAASRDDADLALVLAELGTPRARIGLTHLLARRLVAREALNRYLARGPRDLTSELACRRAIARVQDALRSLPDGLERWLADGPVRHPRFRLLAATLDRLPGMADEAPAAMRAALDRVRTHFLTLDGRPRQGRIPPYSRSDCVSADGWRRHREGVLRVAPGVSEALAVFDRDLNVVLARGVRRLFEIARTQYRRALEERSRLDFTDLLERALALLEQMGEFAQSRFRLESRYHHVLVDEFQDTSPAQWQLVALLIRSWGEGFGLVHDAPLEPTVFVVGDRKQSIYRFRDADPRVLDSASRFIEGLRPNGQPRRTIRQSFRAVPELLAFVNDVFRDVEKSDRSDAFRFAATDEFPLPPSATRSDEPVVGIAAANDPDACAAAVGGEIVRLLATTTVRDRQTGLARAVRPGDIAVLFRSRASHREFEQALDLRHVPAYVYKGLGFFDTDEIKDLVALLRYLADPSSDLRTAALLRSRFFRLPDDALAAIAPGLADALIAHEPPASAVALTVDDRAVLARAREAVRDWLALVDVVPPADLLDRILAETAYAFELRGSRRVQAWENVKKLRSLVRRTQNRGYSTMARIADYVESLHAGDESNAVLEAIDAVHLMTIHAAKGLEFPVVFVVNLAKGTGGPRSPVRIAVDLPSGEPDVAIGTYQSAESDDESARDREETKRLLYVALTRARDRLYLSSVLQDGALVPGRGSLAEVVPVSLGAIIGLAGSSETPPVVEWTGTARRAYPVRVCRPHAPGP